MSSTPLHLHLFGPPEFRINGEPLPHLKTRKGLFILALLALRPGREVERDWLAGTLWPENEESVARTYLRQALTDLRRALGEAAATCLLSPSSRTLRLNSDSDIIAFQECLKRGDTESREQAVALYRGPLQEGWSEDWLLAERESHAQLYLSALETLAHTAINAGNSVSAIPLLRRIIATDPLRESAYRSLMQSLAATRDYAAVTQIYRELRVVLRREIAGEPDTETQTLFRRFRDEARRRTSSTMVSVAPNPERESHRVVSLPCPLTEFIGRARELESAKLALRAARLVTLTGMGGVGKTRLAIRVATEVADDFPDGVLFVDLSSLSDPALVAKTTAVALNISEQTDDTPTQTLCRHLSDRQFLLVLDNCEHLARECARFAATLLLHSPNVRILATSRQRLGITGETVCRVSPMALPDLAHLKDDKNAPDVLREYEAVRLFLDRACRVRPDLPVTPRLLRSIAVICRQLDGIPLALELVAARMGVLEAEQIAARLTERFRLLSRRMGSGDEPVFPARQRTLRATLDWSYDLLLPEEQLLLSRVCVFVGGGTLEAVEAVCAGNGLEEYDILDLLMGLVDHSLLVVESENGQSRYRLLETVREYAQVRQREQTDPTEESSIWFQEKHRDYFLQMAQAAHPKLRGPEQLEWLARLETEHENLRAALQFASDCHGDTGLRLAAALSYFWKIRGHYQEGRAWLERFLALPDTSKDETQRRARGSAGYWLGTLAYDQGDFATAHHCLEQSISLYREIGDSKSLASVMSNQGNVAYREGDYPRARRLYEEALEFYRGAGNTRGIASMLGSLGNIEQAEGNLSEALRLQTESLRLSRSLGDTRMTTYTLHNLGRLATLEKDTARARAFYQESLEGMLALGDRRGAASIGNDLAFLFLEEGNTAEAGVLLREALQTLLELGNRGHLVTSLCGLAWYAWLQNDSEAAARLWGAAESAREKLGIPTDEERERELCIIAEARTAGEASAFDVAWAAGTALSWKRLLALFFTPPPTPPEASFPPPLRKGKGAFRTMGMFGFAPGWGRFRRAFVRSTTCASLGTPPSLSEGEGETTPQAAWGEG